MTRRAAPGGQSYSIDCYRTVKGVRFMAWTSCPSPDRTAAYRKAGVRCRRFGEELFIDPFDQSLALKVDEEAEGRAP